MKYCIGLLIHSIIFTNSITSIFAIECVQCISELDSNCINNPPPSQPCNGADMKYCIILEVKTSNGKLSRLTRTCSPDDIIKEECEDGIENGTEVIVCHRACSTDNCNTASSVLNFDKLILIYAQLLLLMI